MFNKIKPMSTDCSMNNIMDTNLYSLRGSTTEEAAHYERLKFLDKLTYSHVNEVKLLKKMEFKRTILELVKLQGIVPRFKERCNTYINRLLKHITIHNGIKSPAIMGINKSHLTSQEHTYEITEQDTLKQAHLIDDEDRPLSQSIFAGYSEQERLRMYLMQQPTSNKSPSLVLSQLNNDSIDMFEESSTDSNDTDPKVYNSVESISQNEIIRETSTLSNQCYSQSLFNFTEALTQCSETDILTNNYDSDEMLEFIQETQCSQIIMPTNVDSPEQPSKYNLSAEKDQSREEYNVSQTNDSLHPFVLLSSSDLQQLAQILHMNVSKLCEAINSLNAIRIDSTDLENTIEMWSETDLMDDMNSYQNKK